MAFDVTKDSDLIKLRDEQSGDPIGMGYAAVDGETSPTLDLFNLPANNVLPENGPAAMSAKDLLDIIFVENISAGDQFRIQLLYEASQGMDDDLSEFKAAVSALDAGLANKIALLIRPLNRVEVLFAENDANGVRESVIISRREWATARDFV